MNLPVRIEVWGDMEKRALRIIEKYAQWADNYSEEIVTIVYDTCMMQLRSGRCYCWVWKARVYCKLYNSSVSDMSEVMTEL